MHTSLKDVTERAQKYDFSVNFHILIEQTGFRSDILCQKVDIKRQRLVCILKLEGLLQGYVKWKNTMTFNVNFLTQNVGSETSLLD